MDKALKQRLVGASVLVALAVLTLPMLLDGPNESRQESRPIEIPPRPAEVDISTRRFPIGEQPPDEPSTLPQEATPDIAVVAPGEEAGQEPESLQQRLERIAAENAADQARGADPAANAAIDTADPASDESGDVAPAEERMADGAEPQGVLPEPGPSAEEPEPIAADPRPAAVDPAPAAPSEPAAPVSESPGGRYLVQVASFSSTTNADRLAGSLRDSGMPVVTDTVDSAAGTLHRVRVGPFEQRAEAEQVLARLGRQMPDVRPRLVDLRPEDQAPVTRPEDPLVRWVVQVGVFSDEGNAEKLVFQLRDAGFRAMSQAERSAQRTVYRVRVGPEVSREAADRLRDRLEAEQGIRGIVQSTD